MHNGNLQTSNHNDRIDEVHFSHGMLCAMYQSLSANLNPNYIMYLDVQWTFLLSMSIP